MSQSTIEFKRIADELSKVLKDTIELSESLEKEGYKRTEQADALYRRAKLAVSRLQDAERRFCIETSGLDPVIDDDNGGFF